jgi:hypothetical protein
MSPFEPMIRHVSTMPSVPSGTADDEVRQAAFARLDVDELVAVQNDQPVGVENVARSFCASRSACRLGLFVGGPGCRGG